MPQYDSSIDADFLNFYKNCKVQTGRVENTISIDDLQKNGDKYSFKIFTPVDKINIPQYIASHPVYLYAGLPNSLNIENLVPVGDGPLKIESSVIIKKEISVNGKIYFHQYLCQFQENNDIVILIGNCLTIRLLNNRKSIRTEFDLKDKIKWLDEYINALKFVLDLIKYRTIEINNRPLNLLDSNIENDSQFNNFSKWCSEHPLKIRDIVQDFDS